MKKITLLILCLFITLQVFSQEKKHLIGFTVSTQRFAFTHSWQLRTIYTETMLGLEYNYKLNEHHSIAIAGQFSRKTKEYNANYIDTVINQLLPADYKEVYYNFNMPLHYMYHYKGWFARTGLNYQVINGIARLYRDDILINEEFFFGNAHALEYHFAIGKDFTIGNFVGRINAFAEGPIMAGSYLQYGLNAGVFYQF
jgi:hypothetical protein